MSHHTNHQSFTSPLLAVSADGLAVATTVPAGLSVSCPLVFTSTLELSVGEGVKVEKSEAEGSKRMLQISTFLLRGLQEGRNGGRIASQQLRYHHHRAS